MKRLAVLQSNYIPWKGYFDIINSVDEFILYDEVQFTKRDWRNRNKIVTKNGPEWLSIPVRTKGKYTQRISEVEISDSDWAAHHWRKISENYKTAKHFSEYRDVFERFYRTTQDIYLSAINYQLIKIINDLLGIDTLIKSSREFILEGDKTEKIVNICRATNSQIYVTGPAAKAYFDEGLAKRNGIKVEYMDYSQYPAYAQLGPDFHHNVSVIDLIFNVGSRSSAYLKSF